MRRLVGIITILLIVVALPQRISASRKLTFTLNKNTLVADEEVQVTASCSGFSSEDLLYIKGAFFKAGSSNYFGYTKKSDSWIKNSAKTTDQKQITVGTWDRTLVLKSDPSDSGFSESGPYKIKIGFYTINNAGEPSTVNWSDTISDINLTKPVPTTSPTQSPTATQTPKPSKIPTPTRVSVSTVGDTPIPQTDISQHLETDTPIPSMLPSMTPESTSGSVLSDTTYAASSDATNLSSEQKRSDKSGASKSSAFPFVILLFCLSVCLGILAVFFTIRIKQWGLVRQKETI